MPKARVLKTLGMLLNNPFVDPVIAVLPEWVRGEADEVRKELKHGRNPWAFRTDCYDPVEEGEMPCSGGRPIRKARLFEANLDHGIVSGVNVFRGNISGGELRGANLVLGTVQSGEVRGVNAIFGTIKGGDVTSVNLVVGDVEEGNVTNVNVIVGDVKGGKVKADLLIGRVLGGEVQIKRKVEPAQ